MAGRDIIINKAVGMRITFFLHILFFLSSFFVCAQPAKSHATAELFGDLPIDDAAARSILRPGEQPQQKIKNNIFIRGKVSDERVFVGQPVMVTYKLYSALESTSLISKAVSYEGFSVQDMKPDNDSIQRTTIAGKTYRVFTIQQLQLTPLEEGKLAIAGLVVSNGVSYKKDAQLLHYTGDVASSPMSISVQPLPLVGRPTAFNGAMGQFSVRLFADSALVAGETSRLHLVIQGTGNFVSVTMPEINWPNGLQHFSVNRSEEVVRGSFPPTGKIIFLINVVALKAGELTIPAVEFSYFDYQKHAYQTARSETLVLYASEPRVIHAPAGGRSREKKFPAFYYLLPIVILLVLIKLILYRSAQTKKRSAAAVAVTAGKLHRDYLLEARRLYSRETNSVDYVRQLRALVFIALAEGREPVVNSEERLIRELKEDDPALYDSLARFMHNCDRFTYAAENTTGTGVDEIREQAEDLITKAKARNV